MQRVLLLNVNVKGPHWSLPSGTRCPGTKEQIPDTAEPRKHAYPSSLLRRTTGWVMLHEEADSGMPRVPIQAVQIVPTCPACTTGISRWGARKKKAVRREEKKNKKGERGRENIKEEIALSHHWLLVIFLESICMRKNCDFACGSRGCRLRSIPCNIRQEV